MQYDQNIRKSYEIRVAPGFSELKLPDFGYFWLIRIIFPSKYYLFLLNFAGISIKDRSLPQKAMK